MRVVLDTNLLISGLFRKGAPRRVLEAAAAGRFQAVSSPSLLKELRDVLHGRFGLPPEECDEALSFVLSLAEVVEDGGAVAVEVRDPEDGKVLACAARAGAGFIVTGDGDLLVLGEVAGVRVLTVTELLDSIPEA